MNKQTILIGNKTQLNQNDKVDDIMERTRKLLLYEWFEKITVKRWICINKEQTTRIFTLILMSFVCFSIKTTKDKAKKEIACHRLPVY